MAAGGVPQDSPVDFESFWNSVLHNGTLKRTVQARREFSPHSEAVSMAARSARERPPGGEMELVILPGSAVYDGRYVNNGWLNELPDPVTKITWENPLLLSMADAARLGLKDEDIARVTCGKQSLEMPIIVQPGQADGVASITLGYGRKTGNVGANIGVNAYPLLDVSSPAPFLRADVLIARATGRRTIPRTQSHHRLEGRDNARSWTLGAYSGKTEPGKEEWASLIPSPKFPGHKWGWRSICRPASAAAPA